MATLSPAELQKRNNFSIFATRIRLGNPFRLNESNGATVVIDRSIAPQLGGVPALRSNFSQGNSIILPTADGGEVRLTDLYKDSEFSGRTQATTAAEDAEVIRVNNRLNQIKDELGTDDIPLKVGDTVYNVTLCESTPGTPKCDFHFRGSSGFVGHVSHKAGAGARAFQQWSGTSQRVEPGIYAHPETQAFIEDLRAMLPNGMTSGQTFGRRIRDVNLKKLAVYGRDYSPTNPKGENNVDTTMQGNLNIVKRGTQYVLTASSHENKNGTLIDGQYDPIFLAVFKGDRSDHNIRNARVTISPLGGRNVSQYI